MSVLMALAIAATAPAPLQVDLSIEDRRALVYGLKSRIGGAYVLTGLADAESLCTASAACVTGGALAMRDSAIRSFGDLVTRARVNGAAPAAIVSLRGAERISRDQVQVFASVYDLATKTWSGRSIILRKEGSMTVPKAVSYTSRIVDWKAAPAYDL